MLFPNLGPQYLDEKDNEILNRMQVFYNQSMTLNQAFWVDADMDSRFESGDQTLWVELYGVLPGFRQRNFTFNRIKRVVNMVSGHQRKMRKSTVVTPVENGDTETADQFTKIMMWCNQQESILETISESFHGALVTGLNLLQVWVDYRSDPVSGNIKVDNCAYNSFMIDPFFRKADLSDCNGVWKRSYLTRDECISLMPDRKDDIENLPNSNHSRDGKFNFMPESYNYNNDNLFIYDEFYYRTYRKQKILIDTETGEVQEWRSDDKQKLQEFLNMYPTIEVSEQQVPTVKVAIVIQGKVMYDGPNPMGIENYPFVVTLGYFNPQMATFSNRVQGIVRGLRDSQYLYNRRKIIELEMLESQITIGYKYKENALVNPKDIFLNGQGRGLALKDEAQMTDVEQLVPPQIPPSMLQISEGMAREIMEISGVNEELLGLNQRESVSGFDTMLRQSAGITTLQILFDQLDRTQKNLGKLMIDIIQANFTPGKVKRIIEEEPAPQFYNKAFGRYDAAVEEGLNTTTQRQMQFAQLLQLREAGVPITTKDLLEASTMQGKKKIIENAEKQEQQANQMQQMQMKVQMMEQEAQINLLKARAQADTGLGLERVSRIQENQALASERESAAHRDEEAALLNLVKALKEMEGLDLANIEKLIALSQLVKSSEQEQKADDTMQQGVIQQGAQNEMSKNSINPATQPSEPLEQNAMQGVPTLGS
jgi:hypothetical protein